MIFSTKHPQDPKQLIYSLVGTLTDLDPNIKEISSPIELSNALIKEATLDIEQLNTRNKLIKLGNLAVLEQKLPDLKKSIDVFIAKLELGKMDAEKVSEDFNTVIKSLVNATDKLSETDPLKTDALSIISLNNLKLKNIQNQITAASNQITLLERFKSITLYHLSDTINNNKEDKELPLISELRHVLQKLKKGKKYHVNIAIWTFLIAGYNYLATQYYYVSENVEKIPQKTSTPDFTDTSVSFSNSMSGMVDSIMSFVNILSTAGALLSLLAVGFALVSRSFGVLATAIFVGFTSSFAPLVLKSLLTNDSATVTYIEKTVIEYYEFYNLGVSGTIIFISLAVVHLFLAQRKYTGAKQYKSMISKLENKNIDNESENLEFTQKEAV